MVKEKVKAEITEVLKTRKFLSCLEHIVIYHMLLDFMPERSVLSENVSRVFSRLQIQYYYQPEIHCESHPAQIGD